MTWLVLIIIALLLIWAAIALRFTFVLVRPKRDALENGIALEIERGNLVEGEYGAFVREPFSFKTADGLNINCLRLPCGKKDTKGTKGTKGTVIVVHGYTASQVHLLKNVKLYHKLGFDCVTFDQRSCGTSEGKYNTMGAMEREDLDKLYKIERSRMRVMGKTPQNGGIVATHGESMGAATVVLHACLCAKNGVEPPDFVVEDCGYADLVDQLKQSAKAKAHIPLWLVKPLGILFVKFLAGYDIRRVSPEAELYEQGEKLSATPMLFIHGTADRFVPVQSVYRLYDAKSGKKKLRVFEGAEHVRSISSDRAGYERTIKEFLEENNI